MTCSSVKVHLQALLVVCHSLPSVSNMAKLRETANFGQHIIDKQASNHATSEWRQMVGVGHRICHDVESVGLKDVLVEWKARTKSVMRHWPNHSGGSNYLARSREDQLDSGHDL
eukprot:TRINITY_DN43103_c0_g1_i1.p1 TRINITY_DN43103_c0_g1~~TRINITY_DN43103_c0_g1_i1.p1  ORF type:complete len:126 (+),score=11.34 TRINITY_DN43103_c0_g1_i1:38-379(+)